MLDNQKQLDDVLNSLFDEAPLFGSAKPSKVYNENMEESSVHMEEIDTDDALSFGSGDKVLEQKSRNIALLAVPVVLEVAAIYYGINYLL